ncbi:serine hydrolase [Corallococcus exiguus]|nr:serine hydrolase [Corallococcus exiguus]
MEGVSVRSTSSRCCLFAALVLWAVRPSVALAQPPGAAPAARHAQVDALFAPWTGLATPGCAVAVSRDGVLDYASGYGMASLEYGVPITPESIFHVASISKQFTAFAMGLLEQEGKLSRDDDIRKYLPELPDSGRKVTLADLVHHTSGLREQFHLLNMAGWRGDDLMTEDDVLWVMARQRGLNFEPGTEWSYNNTGYTLLSVIIKRVAGKSLRAFAEERIFHPLGMLDTHFHDDHSEVVKRRASAYSPRDGGGWRISVPMFDYYGSTSLFTTVGDLLKWEANLLQPRVGGQALVDWLRTSATLKSGEATGYGAGLTLGTYQGQRTFGHNGADAGYRSSVAVYPDSRLVVAAFCNASTAVPAELVRQVADVYLGTRPAAVKASTLTVPEPALKELAGVYWSAVTDQVLRLEVKDGALRGVGSPMPLVPVEPGLFRVGDSTEEWRFPAQAARSPREVHVRDTTSALPARVYTRVDARLPSASAMDALAGQYHSDEVDMTFTVRMEDGKPRARWQRQKSTVLEAVGGDRFVSDALGTVTFTRAKSGQVDGLTLSTVRARRLRAERLPTPRKVQGR